MPKTENEFPRFLISIKDSANNIDLNKAMSESGYSDIDLKQIIVALSEKDYIIQIDANTIHLYPWGIFAYKSRGKRFFLRLSKLLILTVKNLILFVGGILSGIIVAYATFLINNML